MEISAILNTNNAKQNHPPIIENDDGTFDVPLTKFNILSPISKTKYIADESLVKESMDKLVGAAIGEIGRDRIIHTDHNNNNNLKLYIEALELIDQANSVGILNSYSISVEDGVITLKGNITPANDKVKDMLRSGLYFMSLRSIGITDFANTPDKFFVSKICGFDLMPILQ